MPARVGRSINDLRQLAEILPRVDRSRDPGDDFLLAMADYLVTGDKRDVLALEAHGRTRIASSPHP